MKKLLLTVSIMSSLLFYSKPEDNPYVYDSGTSQDQSSLAPQPPADPVPVDMYVPALLALGLGMSVYFSRRISSVRS